jgi:hypothetical protein
MSVSNLPPCLEASATTMDQVQATSKPSSDDHLASSNCNSACEAYFWLSRLCSSALSFCGCEVRVKLFLLVP